MESGEVGGGMDLTICDAVDLTDSRNQVGRHSVWIPPRDGAIVGIKLAFQYNARVVKYRHPHERDYPLETLGEEVAFMRMLAARRWGPPVGQWVYVKNIVSEHTGAWWCDPRGGYGIEVADVDRLPDAGTFTVEKLRASGLVEGSPGAWGDIEVPSRNNVRRGYLVDVRRSWWDRLRYLGDPEPVPTYREDRVALVQRLARDGTFPFHERHEPYQEFHLDGVWLPGERSVVDRARVLGFDPKPGESVLDLGSCTGGFLQLAALAGAGPLVGLDGQAEFVDLARDLARAQGANICYRLADLNPHNAKAMLPWLRQVYPRGPDHLLVLSMAKHVGQDVMWWWIDQLGARQTYLESNAAKLGQWPLREGVSHRGGRYVGDTVDRNPRRCYVIERP